MANSMRTSALLGTPSLQSVQVYYPFALEDAGRLAFITCEFVDVLMFPFNGFYWEMCNARILFTLFMVLWVLIFAMFARGQC
jgi:hypothetical protein